MSNNLLSTIDQRTRLAGHNRLGMLLFRLGGNQRFGVNVFKVQEVIKRPPILELPSKFPQLLGIADIRGKTIPVLDLGRAIAHPEASVDSSDYLVVTEFNCNIQGFLVSSVDRIVNISVEDIKPPPDIGKRHTYLTAVTRHQNEIIQIIDVEKVIADVNGSEMRISEDFINGISREYLLSRNLSILVVDDSQVARNQIQSVLDQLGIAATLMPDGRQALKHLQDIANSGDKVSDHYMAVISDIEMPDMDGYTLTTEIRRDLRLSDLFVILHTSLSGVFNNAMVERVGADRFVVKYNPDKLAVALLERIQALG